MTSDEATDLIIYNQTVKDVSISGIINFSTDTFDHSIDIQNCSINCLQAAMTKFNKPVKFFNCKFHLCDFSFSYFLGGLEIINCCFKNYLDFQSGGHNKTHNPVRLENSVFLDFVNFFDCSYDGPFILNGNDFQKGTNILGNKNMPYEVTFKLAPLLKNNKGIINLNGEGDKK